jgi:hypothetical protein
MNWKAGSLACRHALCLAREEAFAAKHGTPLSGLEWYRGFAATLGAGGHGFAFGETAATRALAFGFARLAAFGFILEILIVEEMLFTRGKDEIGSAVYALQGPVLELRHGNVPVINLNNWSDL